LWQFQGYVVSDCTAIDYIANQHQYVSSNLEASDVAIQAGTDLNCGPRYQADLVEAVNTGLVTEREIDTAVIRLFAARFKLGEFDPPESVPYTAIPSSALESPEHRALALRTAHESMVLLKNNGILPFDINLLESLAVIGPNAVRAIFGGYSGTQANEVTVTPLEGIQAKVADFGIRVDYAEGTGISAEISDTGIQEAADQAEEITISFNVENTGAVAVDEVTQVYIRDAEAGVPVPQRQLKRFKRVSVDPGETESISVVLNADELSYFDVASGRFLVEPGAFEILVGASSEDIRLTGTLTVSEQR
jgi:hypothetical protein